MVEVPDNVHHRSHLTTPDWFREIIATDATDGTVLDVGCGTAEMTSSLETVADEVVGCDIRQKSLDVAKEKAEHIIKATGTDLPIQSSSVDVVYSVEVIEHVVGGKEMLEECHRVLKDDGVLYLKTPNRWTHDAFQILQGQLRESRDWHPNLYTHRTLAKESQGLFQVEFMKSGLAEYQVEKIKNSSSRVGAWVDRLDFSRLPRSMQPSIYSRCIPR